MIDMHSHILPGVDDGASSLEIAIEMAKDAVSDGISTIAATPHHNNGRYSNEKDMILEQVERLNECLTQLQIPLKVVGGQELRLNDQIWQEIESGNVLTLNETRYLLIELPSSSVPQGTHELIHELLVSDKIPVIAHPERNAELASNPDLLADLVNSGALTQITAGSLTGDYGKKLSKLTLQLCRRGLVHIIASDAHDLTRRKFGMKRAYQIVKEQLGEEVESNLKMNARLMLDNQDILVREAVINRKNNRIFFWK